MAELDELILKLNRLGYATQTFSNRIVVDLGRGARASFPTNRLEKVTTLLSKSSHKIEATARRLGKAKSRRQKSSEKWKLVCRRAFRDKKSKTPQRRVLIPELVKLADSGRISVSECGEWSYVIWSHNLEERLRSGSMPPSPYVIRKTNRGWRIFLIDFEGRKESPAPQESNLTHSSGRSLIVQGDPATAKLQFKIVEPPTSLMPGIKGVSGTTNGDETIRYIIQCKTCGWRAENVKRIEKPKKKHKIYCQSSDFDIFPYCLIRTFYVPRSLASMPVAQATLSTAPSQHIAKRIRVKGHRGGRRIKLKGKPIDFPLHRRHGASAPNVYPDDN